MRRVKKRDYENLSDANVERVYNLLLGEKPITKKEACEILNISYNTTRLNKIIDEWREESARKKKFKAEKRGKPATEQEITTIIQSYLEGSSISEIATSLYRSASFVKNIINRIGVPQRIPKEEQKKPYVLPDECVSDLFAENEVAWSAIYHKPCIVRKQLEEKYTEKYGCPCYQIYIMEDVEEPSPYFPHILKGGFNAFSPAYDIGKLEHLVKFGINVERI
ncbi:MAG TPA: hypothetical protein VLB82_11355 [Thermodesulfobacteriota bacterium]|nr:hypothetical protein [Thermodesulfobacteriota bacterium]